MARRVRPSSGPLDLRSQAILRAVIEEYVTTAQPVGSQALVERYRLGVSSATVRAVLAELEAAGLLTHPHTSRGPRPHRARATATTSSRSSTASPLPPGRAADDPPPVRPGGVRERALVPPRRDDPRRRHPRGGPRDAGQAHLRPPPPPRPRRDQRPPRQPDPRPSRGRAQAGRSSPRRADRAGRAVAPSRRSSTTCSRAARPPTRSACSPRLDAADPTVALHAPGRASASSAASRSSTRAAIEELFSDGLLNVMAAPEFAQSEKLRRVFAALENRAYLARAHQRRRGLGPRPRLHRLREPGRGDGRRVARARAVRPARPRRRRGRRARARPAWPTPRRSARSASCAGLMNELIDHLYA